MAYVEVESPRHIGEPGFPIHMAGHVVPSPADSPTSVSRLLYNQKSLTVFSNW